MALTVISGGVGGVGKSLTSAGLGEYLLAKGIAPAIIEADTKGNVATYFEKAPEVTVHKADLSVPDGWIMFLNILGTEANPEIIVSMPAGDNLDDEEHSELIATAVADMNRPTSIIWLLSSAPEGTGELIRVQKAFAGTPIKFVAALNAFWADPKVFPNWHGTKTREAFVKAGGLEMVIPKLNKVAVDATFKHHPKVRFSANGESGLRYGERIECRRWLGKLGAAFDEISDKIGIGTAPVNA
jgi:hypothetical protein